METWVAQQIEFVFVCGCEKGQDGEGERSGWMRGGGRD